MGRRNNNYDSLKQCCPRTRGARRFNVQQPSQSCFTRRVPMHRRFYLPASLLLAALLCVAAAQTITEESSDLPAVAAIKQHWQAGWDNFGEPINLNSSNVTWSLSNTRKLTVTY